MYSIPLELLRIPARNTAPVGEFRVASKSVFVYLVCLGHAMIAAVGSNQIQRWWNPGEFINDDMRR